MSNRDIGALTQHSHEDLMALRNRLLDFLQADPSYDVWKVAALKRDLAAEVNYDQYLVERFARIWTEVRDAAQQLGRPVPTLDQVTDAETSALGHFDYGSKYALYLAELILGVGQ